LVWSCGLRAAGGHETRPYQTLAGSPRGRAAL